MTINKTITDLSTLKINYLTQEMYEDALENEEINENELYITPGSGGGSGVFLCEYNVTTFADAKDAYDNGKTLICLYSEAGTTAFVPLSMCVTSDDEISSFVFATSTLLETTYLLLDSTGWSQQSASATSTPTSYADATFDSSAKMNSTDMTTGSGSEVENFIAGLNTSVGDYVKWSEIGDFIVEQGTSGIWTYRKWNSGIAECWGITSYASATFSAVGNSFMRGFVDIMLPTNLFNIAPIVFVNPVFGNVGSARTGSISASKFNVAVLSTISNASVVELQLFAKGTWK